MSMQVQPQAPPLCQVHGIPMLPSKFGGFYCGAKGFGEGYSDKGFCNFKVRGPAPRQGTQAAPRPQNDDALKAASLAFAAYLMRGAGPELSDDAIALAIRAYSALKAVGS